MGKKNKGGRPDPMSNRNTMEREAMRTLKNIAFGSFNIYNEGHIFRNLNFVQAAIDGINKKLTEYSIIATSISIATSPNLTNGRGMVMDQNVESLLHKYKRGYTAYSLMRQTMVSILQSGGDTGYLLVLANKLPAYKYNI